MAFISNGIVHFMNTIDILPFSNDYFCLKIVCFLMKKPFHIRSSSDIILNI